MFEAGKNSFKNGKIWQLTNLKMKNICGFSNGPKDYFIITKKFWNASLIGK